MAFRVIERTTQDIENETIALFNECKPYLDKGYGFCSAVRKVKGLRDSQNFASLSWYKRFREYALAKGYHARTRKTDVAPKRGYFRTGEKYIAGFNGKYLIRKQYKGKNRLFGVYTTLEDAIKVRDHCIMHGWKQHSIDRYCEELGVERCRHYQKRLNRRYR